MISPLDCENFLNSVEARAAQALKPARSRIPASLALLVLYYASTYFWPVWSMEASGNLDVLIMTKPLLDFVLPLCLLLNLAGAARRHKVWTALLILSICSWAFWSISADAASVQVWAFPLLMAVIGVLAWLRVSGLIGKSTSLWIGGAGFVLLALATSWWRDSRGESIPLFWLNKPQYYLLFLIAFLDQPSKDIRPSLALQPAHLLFPQVFYFPFPAQSEAESADSAYAAGLVKIAKSLFLCAPLFALYHLTHDFSSWHMPRQYGILLFTTVIIGNLYVGLVETCGIRCPDATYFVFLARSPRDFLKRETLYGYLFSLRYVYFPLLRITRWPAAATLIFFLTFPLYRAGFWPLFAGMGDIDYRKKLAVTVMHWLVWLFGFYVAETRWLRPFLNKDTWTAVAITLVLMGLPYFL